MSIFARLGRNKRLAISILFTAILFGLSCTALSSSVDGPAVDNELMDELKRLYQRDDPDFVIDRLVAEVEASRLAGIARDFLGDSYAGSWFDPDRLQLVVGLVGMPETDLLERLGVHALQMEYSLLELKNLKLAILGDLQSAGAWGKVVHSLYIDYPANQVVILAASGRENMVRGVLSSQGAYPEAFRTETSPGRDVSVASPVRGADEYTNDVFDARVSYDFKCSIGFSVVGGYLTAGHCGDQGHQVSGFNGTVQGGFSDSDVGGGFDRALVSTDQSWLPRPWINGYSDGLITVPAKWGGLKEYPLNSTVCRYGQASNDSNCGVITQSNVTVANVLHSMRIQYYTINGLKRTTACVQHGDSGGPFISAADSQAQGITLTANGTPCPTNANLLSEATFDPIAGPLRAFNSTMLTAHGPHKPTASDYACPDTLMSGSGTFVCRISSYDAQGETEVQWTSSTGHSSQSTLLFGTCNSTQWVSVDLNLTNMYGGVQRNAGFWCPMSPIP